MDTTLTKEVRGVGSNYSDGYRDGAVSSAAVYESRAKRIHADVVVVLACRGLV